MLIQNTHILCCQGQEIQNGYILMQKGCIADVGDMAFCPEAEEVIDAKGLFACPGFIDAHSHAGLMEEGISNADAAVNEDSGAIMPHLRAMDGINPADSAFSAALAAGITTIVTGPGSANPIGGTFCALKTYKKSVEDMLIRDGVAMKFALGENPVSTGRAQGRAPKTRMATAALIREALSRAVRYAEAMQKGEVQAFDFKMEALRPVVLGKMPVKWHVHRSDDIMTALRITKEFHLQSSLEHVTEGYLCAEKLKGMQVCVGPIISDKGKPELLKHCMENAAILASAGASVSIISDHYENPAPLLPLYAALCVRAGMKPMDALEAITKNAAQNCGILDMVGTIEKGKLANICLFDGFPIAFDAKLHTVFAEGEKVFFNKA